MAIAHSPLRYPGGKQILSRIVAHLIRLNGSTGGTYAEPYAGGAGVALALLFGEHVDRILINDADPCIFAFWKAILFHTGNFLTLLRNTPATVVAWEEQREIYRHPQGRSDLQLGFATFFLNRCNRSGIIASGGLIGGRQQDGKWKIDARLNRPELERRIRRISVFRERISISGVDAIDFLNREVAALGKNKKPFVYLDPPYYAKGQDLYLNYYSHDDHARLAAHMEHQRKFPWIMSYDNVREIRQLYSELRQVQFSLDYSARERRAGREVMIFRPEMVFPSAWVRSIPQRYITSADQGPSLPGV
jgi:DNA adenine methylase